MNEFKNNLTGLNKKEIEILTNKKNGNLNAFIFNFSDIFIEKDSTDKMFYIYRNKKEYQEGQENYSHTYIQKCSSIEYVNGWLYGMVQCKCNIM